MNSPRGSPRRTSTIACPTNMFFLLATSFFATLIGCTSSHTVQLEAPQPVYFGTAPPSLLPLDSTHAQFLKTILLTTSHVAEKEHSVQGQSVSIEKEASEGVRSDVAAQLGKALENDPDRFIGNSRMQAHIEVYVPIETYLMDFLGTIIFKSATTEGAGETSSETIGVSGNVYTVRRTGR
jgi:hypothetical protein